MSGWPDPARPGVPLNPERDGWHWIERYPRVPSCFWWCAGWHANGASGWGRFNEPDRIEKWRYIGPSLMPAELAAREAAAFQRGAEAMRAECFRVAVTFDPKARALREKVTAAIRALPVPPPGAPDVMLAEVKAAGMQAGISAGMDEGAEAVIRILASWLGVQQWEGGDGTETWEGDVSVEVGNILAASDIYDNDSGAIATHTLLRDARRTALLEAARIARNVRTQAAKCAREPDLIPNIRREFLAQARGAEDAEDAIRAAIRALPVPTPEDRNDQG